MNEQPNQGLTIIEKIEQYSDVGFAIVLLTPDDVGGLKDKPEELQPRARQNVIFELGYFMAKLGKIYDGKDNFLHSGHLLDLINLILCNSIKMYVSILYSRAIL